MKDSHLHPAGLLQPLPIPDQVFEDIAMNFITCLPSSKGKSTIMTGGSSYQIWALYTLTIHFLHLHGCWSICYLGYQVTRNPTDHCNWSRSSISSLFFARDSLFAGVNFGHECSLSSSNWWPIWGTQQMCWAMPKMLWCRCSCYLGFHVALGRVLVEHVVPNFRWNDSLSGFVWAQASHYCTLHIREYIQWVSRVFLATEGQGVGPAQIIWQELKIAWRPLQINLALRLPLG